MLQPSLFLGAALGTHVLLHVLRPLLVRYALARPNARSSHKVPTPQGAGMAVVAVTLVGIAVAWSVLGRAEEAVPPMMALVLGGVALGVMGAVDDIRGVGALPRLLLQMAAVGGVIAALPGDARVLPLLPSWLEAAALLLGGVWFVNLVNFMDGIDWMTVAEVIPVCGGLGLAGALGALPALQSAAAMLLGGAMVGFAPFNKPVAKVFLGDVGSVPIGLLLVWLLVSLAAQGHIAAALLLPLYYLADATITLFRRLARRERVWEAHRQHYYQGAVDRGYPVLAAVRDVFVVNVVLVGLAVLSLSFRSASSQVAAVLAGATVVAALLSRFSRVRA